MAHEIFALAARQDLLFRTGGRLVSEGLSLSALRLAGCGRQLTCGDDYKNYVAHLDSGFAIHCIAKGLCDGVWTANSGEYPRCAVQCAQLTRLIEYILRGNAIAVGAPLHGGSTQHTEIGLLDTQASRFVIRRRWRWFTTADLP
jgi:hypothetical protein